MCRALMRRQRWAAGDMVGSRMALATSDLAKAWLMEVVGQRSVSASATLSAPVGLVTAARVSNAGRRAEVHVCRADKGWAVLMQCKIP